MEFNFHFDIFFFAGLVLSLGASIWLLFASYACDPRVARGGWWKRGLPIARIRLLLDHKDRLLVPFVLRWVGVLLMLPTIIRFFRAWFALWDAAAGH